MRRFLIIIILFIYNLNFSQTPKTYSSSEIFHKIQKLNFLGSALYVAAHPDDENTHLISYLANDVKARTAYISLTRGDGGQNLIGSELRELLGLIRTQELLQARKIDGGIQYFSRANDFGFSKHPDETFEIWNKDQVLEDLVYIIRKFQPDIIINRFDHRTPGTTHGHHTASAMLSVEAFDLANDKNYKSSQFNHVSTWQPQRLFWNLSWFFFGSQEKFDQADKSHLFALDIGSYYPMLGLSNSEIAAKSRSQHSSQGFGSAPTRGTSMEYLETIKGSQPKKDIFEGIDTSWNRVKGGKKISEILAKVEREFDFKNPTKSIPDLIKAYQLIQNLEDKHWREIKSEEIREIIFATSGLFLEAASTTPNAVAGSTINVKLEALNRSDFPIKLIQINQKNLNLDLKNNIAFRQTKSIEIPKNAKQTSPYWLELESSLGMYQVQDQNLIGLPESPNAMNVEFQIEILGQKFIVQKPIVYKFTDPARGEIYKPFAIVPKASVSVQEKVWVFSDAKSKNVTVKVKAFQNNLKGELSLKAQNDWKIIPNKINIEMAQTGETKTYTFEVIPPKHAVESQLIPELIIDNEIFNQELIEINYDHIPEQKVLVSGASKIVHLDIQKKGNKIGYIMGAGDSVPESLRQIGYEVEILSSEQITIENLQKFDAVVLGIRSFNVLPELTYKNKTLFDYVYQGGNLIVQYNTSREVLTQEIAPYDLTLSRDRVTEENAKVSFIDPNHTVLNYPNKITEKDFENWVQERGLYFPNQWANEFQPILSMNDKGENPMHGSLLVAKYGKGNYVYTGLSFFRELPAGVSGAYRLMANLLSLDK